MRKVLAAILLTMMMLLSVTGCQQTPEASIVVGKSNDALIEKAQGNVGEGASLAERIGALETYQSSVSSEDGRLNVTIDAVVTVPEAESVPIIRVTAESISQEQADVLMAELVHTDLYDPYREQTKEEIMERILATRQQLAAGPTQDDDGIYFIGDEAVTWEEWMAHTIDRLYEEYAAAPEEMEIEPISGEFLVFEDGQRLLNGESTTEEYGYEALQIQNADLTYVRALYTWNTAKDGFALFFRDERDMPTPLPDTPDVAITEAEAITLCDALVAKLDMPYMSCYSAEMKYQYVSGDIPTRRGWVLEYTRCFDGLPITHTSARGQTYSSTSIFQTSWSYEILTFFVNDDGIVGLWWQSPYELGETVVEDAALLSFADAMAVFEKMYVVEMDGQEMDVTVNDIRLGYTRILEQDKLGSGLLVPVWDFFGVITDKSGDEVTVIDDPEDSLLTVNAIDGSIIDRDFGY